MSEHSLSELKKIVGEKHVTFENFEIEKGKVEEFARAIRDENEIFRGVSNPDQKELYAPLIYTRVARFPQYIRDDQSGYLGFDLGFDRQYTVHGEQEYVFERPLKVGDVLTGVTELVDVYQRESGSGGTLTFAVLETTFTDEDGATVVIARQTRIETGGDSDE